jgi:hypothetical protein
MVLARVESKEGTRQAFAAPPPRSLSVRSLPALPLRHLDRPRVLAHMPACTRQMAAALANKQAVDEAEADSQVEQLALKERHRPAIDAWRARYTGNVRGLLSSMQTVVWPESGWVPVGVGDLLDDAQVRKVWMRANLLVHPDKVHQRGGSAEQLAVAGMVFDALKEAWEARK